MKSEKYCLHLSFIKHKFRQISQNFGTNETRPSHDVFQKLSGGGNAGKIFPSGPVHSLYVHATCPLAQKQLLQPSEYLSPSTHSFSIRFRKLHKNLNFGRNFFNNKLTHRR